MCLFFSSFCPSPSSNILPNPPSARGSRQMSLLLLQVSLFLPVMHYIRDDGGEEAEQHDRRAGIHDRVQKLRGVSGERQHLLQILKQRKRQREKIISGLSPKMTFAKIHLSDD